MSFVSTFIPLGRARAATAFGPSLLAGTTQGPAAGADAPSGGPPREGSSARQLALVFACWTLVALASACNEAVYLRALGLPVDWPQVLRRPLTEQWIWAAFTPIVFWLARRVPLERLHLARALALHVLFFVALSLAHCAVAALVGGPLAGQPPQWHGSRFLLRLLQEFYSDIWMYWPLVCIRALLDARRRERERALQAARLQELTAHLQLSLLRAQIQPHFLFNTLHAVTALLRVDPRAAEDMLADLAEILRASFNDPTSQETTLRRELDIVGCYLRIQQRRLGPRLRVALDVAIDTLDAAVPALALQSLVENAVVHGIAPLGRVGTLWIAARRDGAQLEVEVRDDGAGFVAEGAAAPSGARGDVPSTDSPGEPAGRHAGIGLANARERLRHLYADAQSLDFRSTAEDGTRIRMRLPYRIATEPTAG